MQLTFFKKMSLLILAPIIVVMIAMSVFTYIQAKNALHGTLQEQLSALVTTQGESFSALALAYRNSVKELAEDNVVEEVTNAFATDNTDWISLYKADVDDRIARVAEAFDSIYAAGIVDGSGKIIMASKEELIGRDFMGYKAVSSALAGSCSPSVLKLGEHSMGLILAHAIHNFEEKTVGGAFLILDLNVLATRTIDYVSFAKSGAAGVHDAEGVQIMHKNREYVGLEEADSAQFKGMEGKRSGVVYYDFEGDRKICYFYFIPWLNWYLSLPVLESDLYASVTDLLYGTIIIAFIVINFFGILILLFARSTSKALGGIETISEEVSGGKHNMTEQEFALLDSIARRSDEIGGLAKSFKTMIQELVETIKAAKEAHRNGMHEAAYQLEGVVNSTSAATQELSAQIQESSNGAQLQADRIAAAVTAVEEMNATIMEVSQNTLQTAQIANDTRVKAEESEVVVTDFMGAISKVDKSTAVLKNDMGKLSEHVQNINQIMGVISDLADQTNLLALNAAIEAARAGEAGKGFAVVADEVRKLAEKTMASTVRVNDAVISIQGSARSSLHQVADTVEQVNNAIALAEKCQQALNEIMHMASESAERIGSIAVASEQQSATSEEITKTISEINEIVSRTSVTMNEANTAIMEVARQSEQLSAMVTRMKS